MSDGYRHLLFLLLVTALLSGCSGTFSLPDCHGVSIYYKSAGLQGEDSAERIRGDGENPVQDCGRAL